MLRLKRHAVLFISTLLASSCGYDDFDSGRLQHLEAEGINANTSIASISSHYIGTPITITENMVVAGYVTATDQSGNFYRSFFIDDSSGALEIKAGLYDLHNIYPLGLRVVIKLKGLTLGEEKGVKQLGLKAALSSGQQTEYFGYRLLADKYLLRDTLKIYQKPRIVTIPSLKLRDCGRLVRIDDLRLVEEQPDYWTTQEAHAYESISYRRFVDKEGNVIVVATSIYANFANREIPTGKISLTGILYFGRTTGSQEIYYMRLRDERDAFSG